MSFLKEDAFESHILDVGQHLAVNTVRSCTDDGVQKEPFPKCQPQARHRATLLRSLSHSLFPAAEASRCRFTLSRRSEERQASPSQDMPNSVRIFKPRTDSSFSHILCPICQKSCWHCLFSSQSKRFL